MKYKRTVAVTSLSILCAGLISACSLVAISNGKSDNDKGELNVKEVENIRILSSTKSTDGNTITVKYTLKPATINYVNFNTALTWSEREDEAYESSTWHNGKMTTDYISTAIDQNNKTISFTCLAPFGHEMIFTISSPSNSQIQSRMSLNYTRREIEAPKATIEAEGFVENEKLIIQKELPVFSVGSVGDRPTDQFRIEKAYVDASSYSFDSLIRQPDVSGLYTTNFKYLGKDYTNPELLRMAIRDHVKEYFYSLIDFDDPKAFTSKDFEEAFTYEYAAYSMAGQTVFLKNSTIANDFLAKYEQAFAKNAGFQATIYYASRKIMSKKLSITLSADSLTDISLEDNAIVF